MSASNVIGIDLGGTKIAAAKCDANTFDILVEQQISTNAERGFEAVFEDIITLVHSLKDEHTTGIGIGVPGLVRQPEGIIFKLPNIAGAENMPLKASLSEVVHVPVFVDNDANCFTLAEAMLGVGRSQRVVVGITLGTGVGGGIVIDGSIVHGSRGFAGELGHMHLRPGEVPFKTNDKRGDVEQYLSGCSLHKRFDSDEDFQKVLQNSDHRSQIIQELAWVGASLTHLLDPDVIVIGGGAGRAIAEVFPEVQQEMKHWVIEGTPIPNVQCATVERAEVLGAALITS